jgi:uncharacterized membrane protein YfcA
MKTFCAKTLPVLALGGIAGFLNGLLGAAGGILLVAGLTRRMKNGHSPFPTALAVMLPLSALTLWRYHTLGHLNALPSFGFPIVALLGGALGAFLLRLLKPRILQRIFSAITLLSGILLLFPNA